MSVSHFFINTENLRGGGGQGGTGAHVVHLEGCVPLRRVSAAAALAAQ